MSAKISKKTEISEKTQNINMNKKIGRPKGAINKSGKKLDKHITDIKKCINDGIKLKKIAENYNVSPDTLTRFLQFNNIKSSYNSKNITNSSDEPSDV